MASIQPFLWYNKEAVEAAQFYSGILPDSHVDRVSALQTDSPSGPAGSVKVVELTLIGQPFMAMSAGQMDSFNHAISLLVTCDTQDEIDHYWEALLEGGAPEQCGWLKDKYGVSWQIAPKRVFELHADPDKARAKRVGDAMLKMVKLDIAALEAAANGN